MGDFSALLTDVDRYDRGTDAERGNQGDEIGDAIAQKQCDAVASFHAVSLQAMRQGVAPLAELCPAEARIAGRNGFSLTANPDRLFDEIGEICRPGSVTSNHSVAVA